MNWVSDPSDPNNVKVEKAIRKSLKKPTGELTKAESAKVIEAFMRKQSSYPPEVKLTQADLAKVTHLRLFSSHLTCVEWLEKLTHLEYLRLEKNELTSVKGLEKLDQLTHLYLYDNKLTELPKGLEKLTQLTYLNLADTQLTDVKGLEKLTQLKVLNLSYNQLTSVKGLEKFTQLKELYLRYNPALTKAQIGELQKALPKSRIYWPSGNDRFQSNPTK